MDKYAHFWVYEDDEPYLIVNPPDNLQELLDEWHKIDDAFVTTGDDTNWTPVNTWLESKGVIIVWVEKKFKL